MTDLIEEIKCAEQSAKEIVLNAGEQARELLEQNRVQCDAIIEKAVEDAKKDRKDSIAMATQKAEEDAENFLNEQKKKLQFLKEKCQDKEKSLADEIVGRIKNWQ